MEPKNYAPVIEKYIEKILLPKFPEIDEFLVQSGSRSDGKEGGYLYIIFYTKGKMRSWFRNKLHHKIQQMRSYVSIPESIMIYYDINKGNNLS